MKLYRLRADAWRTRAELAEHEAKLDHDACIAAESRDDELLEDRTRLLDRILELESIAAQAAAKSGTKAKVRRGKETT
jgi:hypothetical protein